MKYKNKQDFLREKQEFLLKEMVDLEVDIEFLSSMPPNSKVVKKLSEGSTQETPVEKMLEEVSRHLTAITMKHNIVSELLEKK